MAAAQVAPAAPNKPVAAPAPVPAAAQTVSAEPEKPAERKTASSLPSIKDMMREVTQEATVNNAEKEEIKAVEFSMDNVKSAWSALAESEKNMPRLSTAISQTQPEVDFETKTVHFKVGNAAQKEWIDKNCRMRLESFLRKQLGEPSLALEIEVIAFDNEGTEKKLYMPSQKADYLKENSQEFRDLSKDLELETA